MVKREPLPNQSFKMGNQSMGRKSGRLRAKIELSSDSLSPPFFCLFFYSDGGAFNGRCPPANPLYWKPIAGFEILKSSQCLCLAQRKNSPIFLRNAGQNNIFFGSNYLRVEISCSMFA